MMRTQQRIQREKKMIPEIDESVQAQYLTRAEVSSELQQWIRNSLAQLPADVDVKVMTNGHKLVLCAEVWGQVVQKHYSFPCPTPQPQTLVLTAGNADAAAVLAWLEVGAILSCGGARYAVHYLAWTTELYAVIAIDSSRQLLTVWRDGLHVIAADTARAVYSPPLRSLNDLARTWPCLRTADDVDDLK